MSSSPENKNTKAQKLCSTSMKSGFSIIEVMLVLAITGLMLVVVLSGAFISIASQRYTDAVRSFAEFLRTNYSEVISPEGLGAGNSNTVILGKAIVFDPDSNDVHTATIVGSASLDLPTSSNIITELANVEASLYCGNGPDGKPSTSDSYTPLWQTELRQTNDPTAGTNLDQKFKGTIIISRAPSSGTVHTAYARDLVYNLKDDCTPDNHNASEAFKRDLKDNPDAYNISKPIDICLKSEDGPTAREVRIAADGRNTSAISIIDTDSEENQCR